MRGLLRKIFIEDAALKVFALALSIILFLVRSDWDASTPAYVRVQYLPSSDRMVVSDLVNEVKLVVRGPWSRINRFSESEVDPIVVDLSKREEGELRFTEEMVRLPSGLRVGSFTPSSVYVNFEAVVERTLEVQPIIEGEPAEGYRLGKTTASPRTVRVSGAKAVVEGVRNAPTRPIRVTGLRSPVTLQIKLAPPPKYVRFLDPQEVEVRVDVERKLVERTHTDVPVSITGSTHLQDIELLPPKVTVVLRGPEEVLEQFKGTPELVVDASTEDRKLGTFKKRIQVVSLPPDVAAVIRPDTVHMTIQKPIPKQTQKR